MFHLLLLVAAQASASPVVVPGGQYLLPGGPHQNLLRRVGLPYYPVYPFTNWRLITQDVVIDIDVDYTCVKEVGTHEILQCKHISNIKFTPNCQTDLIHIRVFSSMRRIVGAILYVTTMAQD